MRRRRSATAVLAALSVAAIGLVRSPAAEAVTWTTPQQIRQAQWYLSSMSVSKAWSTTRGRDVTVGVIDSGVDGSVPDLTGVVRGGKDFSGEGSADGERPVGGLGGDPHGTEVASLIAAHGHGAGNAGGVIGVAPDAHLLSASIDLGASTATDQLASALRWLADQHVGVINMSLVSDGGSAALKSAIGYAESKDVVLVAGAGNDGQATLNYPAAFPGVVSVGGVDEDDVRDPESSYGTGLAVVAPYATRVHADKTLDQSAGLPVAQPASEPTQYASRTGTSLATAIVSGIAALIRAAHPTWPAARVINQLLRTSKPLGSGRPNDTYGYGIPDADQAVTANVAAVTANPLGTLATAAPSSPAAGSSSAPASHDAPSSTAPAASSSSGGSSTGVIVGIVVGVLVVLAIIAGLWLRSRRPRPSR